MGEQHEGQRTGDLGVVGQRDAQLPDEPDRLLGEVDVEQRLARCPGIPLGEHQVAHVDDRGDPVG